MLHNSTRDMEAQFLTVIWNATSQGRGGCAVWASSVEVGTRKGPCVAGPEAERVLGAPVPVAGGAEHSSASPEEQPGVRGK